MIINTCNAESTRSFALNDACSSDRVAKLGALNLSLKFDAFDMSEVDILNNIFLWILISANMYQRVVVLQSGSK